RGGDLRGLLQRRGRPGLDGTPERFRASGSGRRLCGHATVHRQRHGHGPAIRRRRAALPAGLVPGRGFLGGDPPAGAPGAAPTLPATAPARPTRAPLAAVARGDAAGRLPSPPGLGSLAPLLPSRPLTPCTFTA